LSAVRVRPPLLECPLADHNPTMGLRLLTPGVRHSVMAGTNRKVDQVNETAAWGRLDTHKDTVAALHVTGRLSNQCHWVVAT
jgi:hypothetical protein